MDALHYESEGRKEEELGLLLLGTYTQARVTLCNLMALKKLKIRFVKSKMEEGGEREREREVHLT